MKDYNGYRSLSPGLGNSKRGGSIKYRLLGDVNNRNQMVLKEIFSVEDRFTRNWKEKQNHRSFNSQSIYDFSGHQAMPRGTPHPRIPNNEVSSASSQVGRNVFKSNIADNLRLLERAAPRREQFSLSREPKSPIKLAKTHIRNRSFDPINGQEKEFKTPQVVLRALGSTGPDVFYANRF